MCFNLFHFQSTSTKSIIINDIEQLLEANVVSGNLLGTLILLNVTKPVD